MKKLRLVGILFVLVGVIFLGVGGYVVYMANSAMVSLQAVYGAQNVTVSYDDEGNFIDRDSVEMGNEIINLLTKDWKFPLNLRNLDPNDPLVNTPDELMLQHAIISYHIMHGTQEIELDEDVEYNGEIYEAGTHEFEVGGRYWTGFDRRHPLEGPARDMAWSGTAHGLLANLAAGTTSHSFVFFVKFVGLLILGLGATLLLGGAGITLACKEIG